MILDDQKINDKKYCRSTGQIGLILQEKVTAPSVAKLDSREGFGFGFSDELLKTNLMVVWEVMKPSWCPSLNADKMLRATQDVER